MGYSDEVGLPDAQDLHFPLIVNESSNSRKKQERICAMWPLWKGEEEILLFFQVNLIGCDIKFRLDKKCRSLHKETVLIQGVVLPIIEVLFQPQQLSKGGLLICKSFSKKARSRL